MCGRGQSCHWLAHPDMHQELSVSVLPPSVYRPRPAPSKPHHDFKSQPCCLSAACCFRPEGPQAASLCRDHDDPGTLRARQAPGRPAQPQPGGFQPVLAAMRRAVGQAQGAGECMACAGALMIVLQGSATSPKTLLRHVFAFPCRHLQQPAGLWPSASTAARRRRLESARRGRLACPTAPPASRRHSQQRSQQHNQQHHAALGLRPASRRRKSGSGRGHRPAMWLPSPAAPEWWRC